MGKIAAQRRRPIGPPARPAIPRASSGRPPASASLGQSADVFWQAGHTNLVSYIGVSLRGRTTGQYARARGDAAEAAAAARRLLPLKLGGAAAERQAGSTAATRCMATATRTSRLSVCYSPLRWHRHGHGRLLEIIQSGYFTVLHHHEDAALEPVLYRIPLCRCRARRLFTRNLSIYLKYLSIPPGTRSQD